MGDLKEKGELRPPIDLYVESWHDVTAVAQLARHWSMEVRSHLSSEPGQRRRQLLDLLQRVDSGHPSSGVLIFGSDCEDQLVQLQKRSVPVVVFGDRSTRHSYVAYDPAPVAELAVQHLLGLGHREIAYLALPSFSSFPLMHAEVESAYVTTCRKQGLLSSANRLFVTQIDPASLRRTWQQLRREHRKVTALICEIVQLAQGIIALAKADGLQVPREISVLSAYDHPKKVLQDAPVTAIHFDDRQMIQMAALRLLDDIEATRSPLSLPVQRSAHCLPRLFERGSTTAVHPESVALLQDEPARGLPFPAGLEWPEELPQRQEKVARFNARLFKGVNDRGPRRRLEYLPLDLGPSANRLLSKQYGWMGKLPLLHLPPGIHEMHGVPFAILKKALVLRSSFARSVQGRALPESVTLEINRKVDGVFILHAGGWLKYHETFARYEFHLAHRRTEAVDVVAFGDAPVSAPSSKARTEASILQDWFPETPAFSSAQAKPYLVTQRGDPLRYLRYLYVYHWANPQPGSRLERFTARILQPELQATLGILAITTYTVPAQE
ncbi:MAG: LacI family transcriptional regulator [Candidatus Competibacteraceae bacterium]|nr:LacI family transcriptional regulator [Candidatus Competibacteraceae bacterium]